MTPTIPPCLQMRRTPRRIGPQIGGYFRHAKIHQTGFNDHFGGELHPTTTQIQTLNSFSIKGTQSAVEISDLDAKEDASKHAENWVTQITMQERHRTLRNSPLKTITHHQLITLIQLGKKLGGLAEVIGCIGITHQHIAPLGCLDTSNQRSSITPLRHGDHNSSVLAGDLLGTITTAIVSDDHFIAFTSCTATFMAVLNHRSDRRRLIETWDDKTEERGFVCHQHNLKNIIAKLARLLDDQRLK
jgi:hypothetical protein